jgi:hypothetical protein
MPLTMVGGESNGLGGVTTTALGSVTVGGDGGASGLRDKEDASVDDGDTSAVREAHIGTLEPSAKDKATAGPA